MSEPSFLATLLVANCCIAVFAAALIAKLNQGLEHAYLRHWVLSWYLYAGHLVLSGLFVYVDMAAGNWRTAMLVLTQWPDYLRIYFLLTGTLVLVKIAEPGRYTLITYALVTAILLVAASAVASFLLLSAASIFIGSLISIVCACLIYKSMRHRRGATLLVLSFITYGLFQLTYAFEITGYLMGSAPFNWPESFNLISIPMHVFAVFAVASWAINDQHKKLDESEEKLSKVALYDHLTGLLNRRGLDEQFTDKAPKQSAFVFFDLDRFKKVNDTHGHETGDWLLVAVSRLLQSAAGKTDLACRLGGDEFIWVVDATAGESAALRKIQSFRESVASMNMVNGVPVSISCSIGVAWFPGDAEDLGELTRQSDQALYEAKERGKNRIVVYS